MWWPRSSPGSRLVRGVSEDLPMRTYRVIRLLVVGYVRVVYRVRVVGREHVPKNGAFVIAPAHRSMLDIPLASAITTRRIRFMGKAPLFRVPVLVWIFTALGG